MPFIKTKSSKASLVLVLDIFSGRPNPEWSLEDEVSKLILDRMTKLTQTPISKGTEASGLGYRGISIKADAQVLAHVFDQTIISDGIFYCDKNRDFERCLLSTAKGKIEDALLRMAMSECEID